MLVDKDIGEQDLDEEENENGVEIEHQPDLDQMDTQNTICDQEE